MVYCRVTVAIPGDTVEILFKKEDPVETRELEAHTSNRGTCFLLLFFIWYDTMPLLSLKKRKEDSI